MGPPKGAQPLTDWYEGEDIPPPSPEQQEQRSKKLELNDEEILNTLPKGRLRKKDIKARLNSFIDILKTRGMAILPANKVIYAIYKKNCEHAIKDLQPPKHQDLYSIISNPDLLILAYRSLGSNTGSATPGATGQSADGISLERIKISKTKRRNIPMDSIP
jgi:hypothetical protein